MTRKLKPASSSLSFDFAMVPASMLAGFMRRDNESWPELLLDAVFDDGLHDGFDECLIAPEAGGLFVCQPDNRAKNEVDMGVWNP